MTPSTLLSTTLFAAGIFVAAGAQAASSGHGPGHGSGNAAGARFHASSGHGHGSWRGGYGHGYRHGGFYGPRVGFYFGVPVLWGPWWGYDPYFYPRERVIYREAVGEPVYEETVRELPRSEGTGTLQPAPTGGPVGTSYCESSRAYFPAVRACPEGWRLMPPNG